NKNQMKKIAIILIISCFTVKATAQATDNLGKDLFVVKTQAGFSFPLTSTGFSVSYTSSFAEKRKIKREHNGKDSVTRKNKLRSYSFMGEDQPHVTDIGNALNPFFINLKVTNL